ncbi:unnamed protein product [Choristocarpus tenellus]
MRKQTHLHQWNEQKKIFYRVLCWILGDIIRKDMARKDNTHSSWHHFAVKCVLLTMSPTICSGPSIDRNPLGKRLRPGTPLGTFVPLGSGQFSHRLVMQNNHIAATAGSGGRGSCSSKGQNRGLERRKEGGSGSRKNGGRGIGGVDAIGHSVHGTGKGVTVSSPPPTLLEKLAKEAKKKRRAEGLAKGRVGGKGVGGREGEE